MRSHGGLLGRRASHRIALSLAQQATSITGTHFCCGPSHQLTGAASPLPATSHKPMSDAAAMALAGGQGRPAWLDAMGLRPRFSGRGELS
jgi:hypothetical protein